MVGETPLKQIGIADTWKYQGVELMGTRASVGISDIKDCLE